MHFLGLENYLGTGMQTVHTVAGYVTLGSLGAALLSLARLRLRSGQAARSAGAVPSGPVSEGPSSAARSTGPLPVLAQRPEQPHASDVGGFDAEDGPTFVAPIHELALAAQSAARVPVQPPLPSETSQVLLVCKNNVEPDEATSPHTRILVTASGVTDRGKKRSTNEDSLLLLHDHGVFAVADGMGGYHGGEIASALAVNTIRETFEHKSFACELESNMPLPRRSRELACSLLEANRAVLALAREKPELSEMGTTLVAARFSPNKQRVYVGNVGDSRCYRFRHGKLAQLTTDHTLRGLGDVSPTKNQLYRAIGVKDSVDIDIIVDVPEAEDVYLLCSDGLPKMASSNEIEVILETEPDLELAAHRLIEFANEAGGRDNVTVILVRIQDRIHPVDAPGKRRVARPHDNQEARRAVNATESIES